MPWRVVARLSGPDEMVFFTRDDDNNLSVGNRNHLKLGIEPESWLQSHELGF